jgi:hypothetical protein
MADRDAKLREDLSDLGIAPEVTQAALDIDAILQRWPFMTASDQSPLRSPAGSTRAAGPYPPAPARDAGGLKPMRPCHAPDRAHRAAARRWRGSCRPWRNWPTVRTRGLHTLYISPLKALAADIRRNLTGPITEMGLPIRVEDRTGDTPSSRKKRQRADPPHILLTTPESLALLTSYEDAAAPLPGSNASSWTKSMHWPKANAAIS